MPMAILAFGNFETKFPGSVEKVQFVASRENTHPSSLLFLSRNLATHRGTIKKMKFAPGRGNVKLMLQFADGVDVWDIAKVCLNEFNEYRRVSRFSPPPTESNCSLESRRLF